MGAVIGDVNSRGSRVISSGNLGIPCMSALFVGIDASYDRCFGTWSTPHLVNIEVRETGGALAHTF